MRSQAKQGTTHEVSLWWGNSIVKSLGILSKGRGQREGEGEWGKVTLKYGVNKRFLMLDVQFSIGFDQSMN